MKKDNTTQFFCPECNKSRERWVWIRPLELEKVVLAKRNDVDEELAKLKKLNDFMMAQMKKMAGPENGPQILAAIRDTNSSLNPKQ